ncbi:MAG: hypothetical protein LBI44_01565 [Oscillospiraceae bacterium]|jgi:hypothetical protein|nr:hypothetical protein [Oscillospiraceae bacterium]
MNNLSPPAEGPAKSSVKKLLITAAAAISFAAVVSLALWLMYPAILKASDPQKYMEYSFAKTAVALSKSDVFFTTPRLDGKEPYYSAVSADGLKLIDDSGELDLPWLRLTASTLFDKPGKRAMFRVATGYESGNIALLLHADAQRLTFGYNADSSVGWYVNNKTFGSELSELGVGIDEGFALDLERYLFAENNADTRGEEYSKALLGFYKKLKFTSDDLASPPSPLSGPFTAMTAAIDEGDARDLLQDLTDIYFEQFADELEALGLGSLKSQLRAGIKELELGKVSLTCFISGKHIVQAARLGIEPRRGQSVAVTVGMCGEQNLPDHVFLSGVTNDDGVKSTVSIDSQGQHVPVDGTFTDVTVIKGTDMDTVKLTTKITNGGKASFTVSSGGKDMLALEGRFESSAEELTVIINSAEFTADTKITATPAFAYEALASGGGDDTLRVEGKLVFSCGMAGPSDFNALPDKLYALKDFDGEQLLPLLRAGERLLAENDALNAAVGSQLYLLLAMLGVVL